jgi:hypothetical protein
MTSASASTVRQTAWMTVPAASSDRAGPKVYCSCGATTPLRQVRVAGRAGLRCRECGRELLKHLHRPPAREDRPAAPINEQTGPSPLRVSRPL